jgi:hypothetical protein
LVFSGTILGDFAQSFLTGFSRLTPVEERQNFWAPTVLQDGRYPAQTWSHTFKIFKESDSRGLFMEFFFNLEDQIDGDPLPLTLSTTVNTRAGFAEINFGDCYLTDATQDSPGDLMTQKAGFIDLTFIGNTKPTRTYTP